MPPKNALADAWDDDWESLADKEDEKPAEEQPKPKLTKAQLKAQHAELNKQLWQAAENPEPQWYPEVKPAPVAANFKPKVTMLARKPTPQVLSRSMAGMNLDDDDDDSEEERKKKAEADFEERKARAAKERAEKERKYAEARERIFGSPAASAAEDSRSNSPSKPTRGKGRGGRGGRDSQPRSSNEQSPARTAAPARQLFDPTYTPKPASAYIQKKESGISRPSTPSTQEKPVRQPQGPARGGGRGFAPRGRHGAQADSLDTVSFVFGTIPPEDEYTPQVQLSSVFSGYEYAPATNTSIHRGPTLRGSPLSAFSMLNSPRKIDQVEENAAENRSSNGSASQRSRSSPRMTPNVATNEEQAPDKSHDQPMGSSHTIPQHDNWLPPHICLTRSHSPSTNYLPDTHIRWRHQRAIRGDEKDQAIVAEARVVHREDVGGG
ncbi:hypothetical protein TW65_01302 [Stemphylium lycopersici]|uniref:SUZ domain-containing protein n=1 Tax=Stemphylium lycopersici TaxID=183478 RepID=A0A364N1B4_STELY|nr:hypothetical protein TW65_01302 [Stemphylium lycopersici]RAR09411.1 hypothetical protein DDE83_005565 [Stemphylium lycopersici]